MDLANSNIEDIKPIANVCPSCKSDAWKTAKMIVMEGTTVATGTIDGKVTDPGMFAGGVRNFLLSDRWFSLDHKIQAEFEFKASSGLVEAVRQLMLAHGANLQIRPIPPELKRVFTEQIISPVEPRRPPETAILPSEPTLLSDQPWYIHFMGETFISGVLNGILALFFPRLALALFVLSVPVCFVRSFKGNERMKANYEEAVRTFPARLAKAHEDHRLACAKYETDIEVYGRQKEQVDQYHAHVQDIMTRRELLWEQARVCMRCGTAYINKI